MLQDFKFRIGWQHFGSVAAEEQLGLGLGHLPSLRSVTVIGLDYFGNGEAKKKLEQEAAVHPNHPLRIHWRSRYVILHLGSIPLPCGVLITLQQTCVDQGLKTRESEGRRIHLPDVRESIASRRNWTLIGGL